MLEGKRLLFLGAHCDDVELGCGGAIAQLAVSAKTSINIRVLSKTLVDGDGNIVGTRDLTEQDASFAALGLTDEQYKIENISGGQVFPENRQKILDYLYTLKSELQPDLIFTMSSADVHQDHRALHDATVKAFNRQNILEYGILNSARHMRRDIYIPLNERALRAKLASLACFKSMKDPGLSLVDYFDPEVIRSEARVHGLACGEKLAEGFGCYRMRIVT